MTTGFYKSFAEPAMLALARAGNRGCRVDTTLRTALAEKAVEDATVAELALATLLGRKLNPNSPKQVQELLYKELRLPEQRKPQRGGERGAVTADEEAIKRLRRLAPQHTGLLTLLLDYRGHTKRSAMLSVPLELRDGEHYFLTSYNATGTETGRISSSEHVSGYGGNLQNQERGPTRRIFVARKGMSFVKVDGSQAEARVVAALARDLPWLERFSTPGYDVHVENASFVYAKSEEKIRAEALEAKAAGRDSLRQKSKPVTHGANYMGGPHVAVKMADVTYAEAKLGLQRYLAARSRLQWWWSQVETTLNTTHAIRTVWGRLRLFLGRSDSSTLREAVAHEPQSTVGDLINHAFFHLDTELESLGGYPLLQAHDEIVAEVPEGRESEAAVLLRKYIEWPLRFPWLSEPLVIPADLGVGKNWYDLEKWKGA